MGKSGLNKDIFSDLSSEYKTGKDGSIASVVDFVESSWGLNLKLFPTQRVMLKVSGRLIISAKANSLGT